MNEPDRFFDPDEQVGPLTQLPEEEAPNGSTLDRLVLRWRDMPTDPVFGWGLRCDQQWLEHSVGPAGYEIRHEIGRGGYRVTWWHGNRGHCVSTVETVDAAKDVAAKHLREMVNGIIAQNATGESRGIPRTLDPIVGSSSEGTE